MLCAYSIKYRQGGNSESLGSSHSSARSLKLPKRSVHPIPICIMSKNRLWESIIQSCCPFPESYFPGPHVCTKKTILQD